MDIILRRILAHLQEFSRSIGQHVGPVWLKTEPASELLIRMTLLSKERCNLIAKHRLFPHSHGREFDGRRDGQEQSQLLRNSANTELLEGSALLGEELALFRTSIMEWASWPQT